MLLVCDPESIPCSLDREPEYEGMGMGLVCSEVSSGGCWKRSERRVSWDGDSTALSPLSADRGLWGGKRGWERVREGVGVEGEGGGGWRGGGRGWG